MKEFFLVATPGLEPTVAAEFKLWFPELEAKIESGGVTVHAEFAQGLSFNQVLKTPTRILVRLTRFSCRDFPKLFQKLSTFTWHEWLDPRAALDVHASVHRSRMKIKSRIEETAQEAWKAWQDKRKSGRSKNPPPAALYIRVNDNQVTLSLDTSGERLHKRGVRKNVGEAPLRETLAAALLMLVEQSQPEAKEVELFDPMMGSGVFLLEALQRDQKVDQRDFAAFRAKPSETPKAPKGRPAFKTLIGYEVDANTLKAAQENLAVLKGEAKLVKADIFNAESLPQKSSPRWLVSNPPYGERIKIEGPLDAYYAKLFAACEKVASPDRACFLLPRAAAQKKLVLPVEWKVLKKLAFTNGGIPVVALVIGRKSE